MCERITHRFLEIKVILTDPGPSVTNDLGFAQAFLAGARACLPRHDTTHEACLATVQAVLEDRCLFGEEVRLRAHRLEPLTPREEEVLALIAQGLTSADMAEVLHLTEKTVRNYTSCIRAKLGMAGRLEAALYARRLGLWAAISP